MSLEPKQQKFVQEYLIDPNATQAAMKAGYGKTYASANVQGARLLAKDSVIEAIRAGQAKIAQLAEKKAVRARMTQDEWLAGLEAIAKADITEAFDIDPQTGKATISIKDLKARGFGKLLSQLKVHPNGAVEFRLHPKLQAHELLAKHHGWVSDTINLPTGGVQLQASLSEDQLKALFADPEAIAMARRLAQRLSTTTKPGLPGPDQGGNDGQSS